MIGFISLKRTLWLAVMLTLSMVIAGVCSAEVSSTNKRLIMFQGFILSAYYNDQYIEIKRLKPTRQHFYGYGWLDDDKVFVAYQSLELAAYAEIEIVDLRLARTTKLEGIGGVGESNFDVNPSTGNVVYSNGDEINLIKIDVKTNLYQEKTVKKTDCWGGFWIDNKTIGCKLFDKEGKSPTLVKYSIP